MNFTLNQLMIFRKVVEFGSITKAAEAIHLTQPAVSIQLKNFQDQFDVALTEVVGRKLYVTDFGHEIAAVAERILNEVQDINFKTLAFKGQLAGNLRLSVVSTGKYVMPYFLTDFLAGNPGVDLQMDVTNKHLVVGALERNEVDFALVSILPANLKINSIDLLPNELYLVGSAKLPMPTSSKPSEVFKDLTLIYREEGSGTRQTMEQFFTTKKIQAAKKLELTSNEAVKQAVLAHLGHSIMPLIGIRYELQKGTLKIIPVNGLPITTTWRLIWLHDKRLSPIAQAFLKHLEAEKERIIADRFPAFQVDTNV